MTRRPLSVCPNCHDGGEVVTDGHRGDRCVLCGWLSPGYSDFVLPITSAAGHHPLIGLIHMHEDEQRRAS